MRIKLFVAALAVVALVGCGNSPSAPTPSMVILSPKANTQLRIGDTITIQWKCVECQGVKADRAVVMLNSTPDGHGFDNEGFIIMGFLNDSRSWTVGRVRAEIPMGTGAGYYVDTTTVRPGFYYIEVSSYPPPSETSWTEATSGFGGVLVELVQ